MMNLNVAVEEMSDRKLNDLIIRYRRIHYWTARDANEYTIVLKEIRKRRGY